MNLQEAASIASQLKNHFRAFEKLEELLLASANLDGAIHEKEKRVTELVAREEDYKEAIVAHSEAYEAAKVRHQKLLDDQKIEADARATKLEAAHTARLDELNHEYNTRANELSGQIAAMDAERKKVEDELEVAQSRLEAAKQAHADFITKVGTL